MKEESDVLIGVELDGGYRVEELLRADSLQRVYRAKAVSSDETVQVLFFEALDGAAGNEAFTAHASRLTSLASPHILSIIAYGTYENARYLVTPSIEGESLRAVLSRVGTLDRSTTLHIVQQAASGLGVAHEQGVVHAGLTPESLFIDGESGEELRVLIADFATGLLLGAGERGEVVTPSGKIIGDPAYLSPEQIKGEGVGEKSDIYSLAVISYEMLSGKTPFVAEGEGIEEVMDLLSRQANDEAPPLEANVPTTLANLIGLALAKNPADRPISVYAYASLFQETIDAAFASVVEEQEQGQGQGQEQEEKDLLAGSEFGDEDIFADDDAIGDEAFAELGEMSDEDLDYEEEEEARSRAVTKLLPWVVALLLLGALFMIYLLFFQSEDAEVQQSTQEEVPVQTGPRVGAVDLRFIVLESVPGKYLEKALEERFREVRGSAGEKEELAALHKINTQEVGKLLVEVRAVIRALGEREGFDLIVTSDADLATAPYMREDLEDPAGVLLSVPEPVDLNQRVIELFNALYQ